MDIKPKLTDHENLDEAIAFIELCLDAAAEYELQIDGFEIFRALEIACMRTLKANLSKKQEEIDRLQKRVDELEASRLAAVIITTLHEHGKLELRFDDDPDELGYRAWIPSTLGCECHPTIERAIQAAVTNEYHNKPRQENGT